MRSKSLIALVVLIGLGVFGLVGADKISEYLTDDAPDGADYLLGVDTDDTTQGAAGTTKKYRLRDLPISDPVAAALDFTNRDDITWGKEAGGSQLWSWNTGAGVDPNLQISDTEFNFNKPIRAPSFVSNSADGEHFLEATNTVAITLPATLGRLAWYDGKWRLANGTDWITDFLLTHKGLSTDGVSTTGTINGRARVVSAAGTLNLTPAYFGSIILMTGPGEVGLPDCSSSTIGAFVEVRERDAAEQIQLVMYGDTTSDAFVLEDGTVLTANYEADLAMGANNRVCVTCLEENRWYIDEIKGDVTNGGAAD